MEKKKLKTKRFLIHTAQENASNFTNRDFAIMDPGANLLISL
jgi:hypothetical protein